MSSDITVQIPHVQLPATNNRSFSVKNKGIGTDKAAQSLSFEGFSELTEEEKAQVQELKKIDQEVRAHEAAHKNVGGKYASNPTYTYTVGPDDNRYATGGEVQIDTAPIEGDPEATIAKMDVVIAAALAPAKPSAQDRKVAATAVAARNQARAELIAKKKEEQQSEPQNTFDVNDFGQTNSIVANKAYETGRILSEEGGQNTHSVNIAG